MTQQYNRWTIPEEFADIFEMSLTENGDLDFGTYYQLRDSFYQYVRGARQEGTESSEQTMWRFEKAPVIENPALLAFAASTAEYYCRDFSIPAPQWSIDIPPLPEYLQPWVPSGMLVGDLQTLIDTTPEEMRKRGFIYSERNFIIY